MWDGPYGDWGSKKYLVSSLDQSLKRMQLDYVDIFYHHRPDPLTPLEETISALDLIVRQGKVLYVGISNYGPEETRKAYSILKSLGTPILIHQPKYSMFVRWVEDGLLSALEELGIGCISFSPLAQGLLTKKYFKGIPKNSRAAKKHGFLQKDDVTKETIEKVKALDNLAQKRRQTISQLALAWNLRHKTMTSVLVGASSVKQVEENVAALNNLEFTNEELNSIENILNKKD